MGKILIIKDADFSNNAVDILPYDGYQLVKYIHSYDNINPTVSVLNNIASLVFTAGAGSAVVSKTKFPYVGLTSNDYLKIRVVARSIEGTVHVGVGTTISNSFGDHSEYYDTFDVTTIEQEFEVIIRVNSAFLTSTEALWIGRHSNNSSTSGTVIISSLKVEKVENFDGYQLVDYIHSNDNINPTVSISDNIASLVFSAGAGSAVVDKSDFPLKELTDTDYIKVKVVAKTTDGTVHLGVGTTISSSFGDHSDYYDTFDVTTDEQEFEVTLLIGSAFLTSTKALWIGRHTNNSSTFGTIIISSLKVEKL